MRNDSNIVSFEDAKRSVRGRFVSTQTQLIPEEGRSARSKRARAIKEAREERDARAAKRAHEEREEEPVLNLKEAKKKAKAKAKAERAFNKMYGDDSTSNKGILGKLTGKNSNAPASDSAGPRAAVYKGEMGAKHRKAAAMQSGKSSGFSFAFPFSFGKSKTQSSDDASSHKGFASRKMSKGGKVLFRLGVSAACLFIFCAAIYAPAQQCYVQIRERDRLAAEYEAVMERNNILENNVDNLQSEPGIEDLAHSSFGLIKEGENAGSVSGLNLSNKSTFTAKVIPGSVPAPDTWYSGVLDWLFGYSS